MAEGTRLNSLQEQIHTLQTQIESLKTTDTIVPKWWDEQKQSIEAKFVENQGYLSRVLELLAQKGDKQVQMERGGITSSGMVHQSPTSQSKAEGKNPVLITVVDEQGHYTYKPDEPGILPAKQPNSFPQKTIECSASHFAPLNAFTPRPKIELPLFDAVTQEVGLKNVKSILLSLI